MEENNYCVLIGDIIKSRKYSNRNEIKKIECDPFRNKQKIFGRFSRRIYYHLGDEFQGVLNKPDRIFQIIDNIRFSMRR